MLALAASADGYLATAGADATTRIWDVRRRTLLGVFPSGTGSSPATPNEIVWDDGAHVLVVRSSARWIAEPGAADDKLYAPDGRRLGTREPDDVRVGGLTPVRQGGAARWGAIASHANERGVLDFIDRQRQRHELELPSNVTTIDRATDLETLVAGTSYDSIVWWRLDKTRAAPIVRKIDGDILEVAFARAGDALVGARRADGKRVAIVPRDPGAPEREIARIEMLDDLTGVEISPDGARAVVATNAAVVGYDVATGNVAWRAAGATRIQLAPGGTTLIAPREDGAITLRDLTTGREVGSLGNPVRAPRRIAWVDATHLMAADPSHVAVWNVGTGELVATYTQPPSASMDWLQADVVGGDVVVARMTLCAGESTTAIAWIDRWTGATPPAELLRGRLPSLTVGCSTATATTWPPPRGVATSAVPIGIGELDFSTGLIATKTGVRGIDGRAIELSGFRGTDSVLALRSGFAVATGASGITVWSARDGALVREVEGHGFLGVSDDGARATFADRVVDLASGAVVARYSTRIATAVAVGRNPEEVWIGEFDGELLHVTATGRTTLGNEVGTRIARLVLSPDGKRLVALGDDGGLRILDRLGHVAVTLAEFTDDEAISFTPGGAYGGSAEAAERVGWLFDRPYEVFRFEQFATTFRRPDVVRARLAGGTSDLAAGLTRPPTIEVAAAPRSSAASARIVVRVGSQRRVDAVRAYREGREVVSAAPCTKSGEVALEVPLLQGLNTVELRAFDDLGIASNAAVANVERAGGPKPTLHVVAVGVGAYAKLGSDYELPLATADAKGIVDALRAEVGTGGRFAALAPQVLLDDAATPTAIMAALDKLATMTPDDLAIVFLAGHGVKPTPTEDMLFVTGSVASLAPASLRTAGVAWGDIATRLAHAQGRVLVLLDACHSGHVSQDLVVPNDRLANTLARERRAGVVVFAAAKGRQSSYEPAPAKGTRMRGFAVGETAAALVTAGGEHAFFTGALIASLRDRAADRNGNGVLEMSEWVQETTDRVTRATQGRQTPWVARREMFGDFAILNVRR